MSVPTSRLIVLRDRLETGDDSVLKKTLRELERVDMTFDMLKESGIGVAVNQLRHHDTFGSMARQLVAKWKQSAADESTTSNGYGSSNGSSSKRSKRYSSSNSPSPPPPSKKQRLDNHRIRDDKSTGKKKSTKPKVIDEDGNFTANCGSFEQILGLNDSSVKNHGDRDKKKSKSKYDDRVMNGDEKRAVKMEKTRSTADSGYSKSSSSSSTSNVDWSKVLPTKLATEYRPQPRSAVLDFDDDSHGRKNNKSGADSDSDMDFSHLKKTKLSKIYSGRRNIFLQKVPTLFESCINVLCDNIDALGYTGGVPFEILEKVLKRATATQLYRVEEWNPYLLEDTGDLWRGHCNRDFKGAEPDIEEGESWRELYERMLAERDEKLNKLKQVISEQKAAKESAVRQAKMAMAKAPRDVRRRQMKYGTFNKETRLPDTNDIVQGRRNLDTHSNAKTSGRVYSHVYEEEQRAKEQPKNRKEKIAPLMAKSLKMMKLARSRN